MVEYLPVKNIEDYINRKSPGAFTLEDFLDFVFIEKIQLWVRRAQHILKIPYWDVDLAFESGTNIVLLDGTYEDSEDNQVNIDENIWKEDPKLFQELYSRIRLPKIGRLVDQEGRKIEISELLISEQEVALIKRKFPEWLRRDYRVSPKTNGPPAAANTVASVVVAATKFIKDARPSILKKMMNGEEWNLSELVENLSSDQNQHYLESAGARKDLAAKTIRNILSRKRADLPPPPREV